MQEESLTRLKATLQAVAEGHVEEFNLEYPEYRPIGPPVVEIVVVREPSESWGVNVSYTAHYLGQHSLVAGVWCRPVTESVCALWHGATLYKNDGVLVNVSPSSKGYLTLNDDGWWSYHPTMTKQVKEANDAQQALRAMAAP